MAYYIIVETENGQTIINCDEGRSPLEAAEANGGLLVDDGPFATYEDALDALTYLTSSDEEDLA